MKQKLLELDARFVGNYHAGTGTPADPTSYQILAGVDGAQGVLFVCPRCGGHSVLCWFSTPRNAPPVPADASPKPGRWTFSGDSIESLTLQPSVDLSKDADGKPWPAGDGHCLWHGWVTNGEAE